MRETADAPTPQPAVIDAPLTEADVVALFEAILRRDPEDPDFVREMARTGRTVRQFIVELRGCDELRDRVHDEARMRENATVRGASFYRCPRDLARSQTLPRRVLLFGSCLMDHWRLALAAMEPPCASELYIIGGDLPEQPLRPIADYDFQIVHPPLRYVLRDNAFARLAQDDIAGHQALFDHCRTALSELLKFSMRWNLAHGITTFVLSLLVPQQNPVGRMLPRHDLRNPVFFIEKLNEALEQEVLHYANAWYFDLNEVVATHGRRFVQEDMAVQINHGSFMIDFDAPHDVGRLEPARRMSDVYESRVAPLIAAAWQELLAMLRTLRQTDTIKLVVVDLDDTLWRGTLAETEPDDMPTSEGWPNGLWEALLLLKRRGVLLGIISQNDEARVCAGWERILHRQLSLEDFAVRRIDWRPKSEKMAEVLEAVNLLPRNVLYIDDNPVQRSEIQAAFPEIRVLGGDPFTWRHILLWAPETQSARITDESRRRTEMVQAQQRRDTDRQATSREAFLGSLDVRLTMIGLDAVSHPRFPRVLELINKTNQFNTTGVRWTEAQCAEAFGAGARMHAFELADIYTGYGLVGALLVVEDMIVQFVMSCRVLGLDAEVAAVAQVVAALAARGQPSARARLIETESNLPCRTVFARCGFMQTGGGTWERATTPPLAVPAHVTVVAG